MCQKFFCIKTINIAFLVGIMMVHKSEGILEFTMETSKPTEYLLLASEMPVTLRCKHELDETVNILLRHMENDNLIVDNSVFIAEDWPDYEYSAEQSQHDLTIKSVSRAFNGYTYTCIARPSARTRSLSLVVIGPPECNINFEEPIFYSDDLGDLFEMTCTIESDHSNVNVNIVNSLIGQLETNKPYNDTHKTAVLKKEIQESWNGSFFYCDVTLKDPDKSQHEGSRLQHECSYGPLEFHEQLQVEKPVKNSTYYKGDTVTFSCKSNIMSAKREWLEVDLPNELKFSRFETEGAISLSIKSVPDSTKMYTIKVKCGATYGRKHVTQEFFALVYGNGIPWWWTIIQCVVTLFSLIVIAMILRFPFPQPGNRN